MCKLELLGLCHQDLTCTIYRERSTLELRFEALCIEYVIAVSLLSSCELGLVPRSHSAAGKQCQSMHISIFTCAIRGEAAFTSAVTHQAMLSAPLPLIALANPSCASLGVCVWWTPVLKPQDFQKETLFEKCHQHSLHWPPLEHTGRPIRPLTCMQCCQAQGPICRPSLVPSTDSD